MNTKTVTASVFLAFAILSGPTPAQTNVTQGEMTSTLQGTSLGKQTSESKISPTHTTKQIAIAYFPDGGYLLISRSPSYTTEILEEAVGKKSYRPTGPGTYIKMLQVPEQVYTSNHTFLFSSLCDGTSPGSPLLNGGAAVYSPGLSKRRGGGITSRSND